MFGMRWLMWRGLLRGTRMTVIGRLRMIRAEVEDGDGAAMSAQSFSLSLSET